MRTLFFILLSLLIIPSCQKKKTTDLHDVGNGIAKAEAIGINLAVQTGSFQGLSFIDALDKIVATGIKNVEILSDQQIGGKWGDQKISADLSIEDCKEIQQYAESKGVKLVGYGVFKTDKQEDWEKLFIVAENLGLSYVVCEPEPAHLTLIDSLAQKYNIKVGIHNEERPSAYWNPDSLLVQLKDCSNHIGFCGDLGNWVKSDVDCVQTIEDCKDRLVSFHLKDLSPIGLDATEFKEVVIGGGVVDVEDFLLELFVCGFKGYVTIEYDEIGDEESYYGYGRFEYALFYYDRVADLFLLSNMQ